MSKSSRDASLCPKPQKELGDIMQNETLSFITSRIREIFQNTFTLQTSVMSSSRQIRTAWIIGGRLESLAAAFYLMNDAEVSGNKICILDSEPQSEPCDDLIYATIGRSMTEEVIKTNQDDCFWRLLYEEYMKLYGDRLELPPQPRTTQGLNESTRAAAEIYMSDPANFTDPVKQHHLWLKNRKATVNFLVKNEEIFEQKSIDAVFDSVFFRSGLWEYFSRFGFEPSHSALEFHRYLCKYLDDAASNDIQAHSLLAHTSHKSILEPLRSYLKANDVQFKSEIAISDIIFVPEYELRTVCRIDVTDRAKMFSLPVAAEDIVIVAIGSSSSGSSTGTAALPPPALSGKAEKLLDNSWSVWYRLARKSPKFGNPSAFTSDIPDSRLVVFAVSLPTFEFDQIYAKVKSGHSGCGRIMSVAKSNWSLKVAFLQQQVLVNEKKKICTILGYGLTPSQQGTFVKKPLTSCCGDEIMAELLECLGLPLDRILESAVTVPRMLPLGLSPFLRRAHNDRPDVVPANTTNIALVGQYAGIKDETVLTLDYSLRCAQVAVYHLMGLKSSTPRVKKSFIAARYGINV